jgi:hypothetical protein
MGVTQGTKLRFGVDFDSGIRRGSTMGGYELSGAERELISDTAGIQT